MRNIDAFGVITVNLFDYLRLAIIGSCCIFQNHLRFDQSSDIARRLLPLLMIHAIGRYPILAGCLTNATTINEQPSTNGLHRMLLALQFLPLSQPQLLRINNNCIILLIVQQTMVIHGKVLLLVRDFPSQNRLVTLLTLRMLSLVVFLNIIVIVAVDYAAAAFDVMYLI